MSDFFKRFQHNGANFSVIWGNTSLIQSIRCEPLGEHIIHWRSAVFFIISLKRNSICSDLSSVVIRKRAQCDMGWYRYTYHSKKYCTKCDMGWYRYTSHSENHWAYFDMGWYRYTSHNEIKYRLWESDCIYTVWAQLTFYFWDSSRSDTRFEVLVVKITWRPVYNIE